MRPHGQQPTRLPRPWDPPGKNTGVGCHFLLQCMRVKSEREVAQSCPTPRDPMDCSPPGTTTISTEVTSAQSCLILCNPTDCSRQAPLSLGFFRQEYWSGLSRSPPGDLPDPGTEPGSLVSAAQAGGFFTTSAAYETSAN